MSKNLCGQEFTLSQTCPGFFLSVCSTSLFENTVEKKQKLLTMSDFSFSHSVFYPFGEFLPFSSNSKFTNSFSLKSLKFVWERVNILSIECLNLIFTSLPQILILMTLRRKTKNPLENIHLHPLFNSLPNDKIFY